MAFVEIAPKRGRNHTIAGEDNVVLSWVKRGDSSDGIIPSFCIGRDIMEQLRWVIGDTVNVAIDVDAGLVRVTRSPSGGYTLGAASGDPARKARGKCMRARFKLAIPGMANTGGAPQVVAHTVEGHALYVFVKTDSNGGNAK